MSAVATNMPVRPKQRFCKNGHDTWVCGRYKNNQCVRCRKDYDRSRDARREHGMTAFAREKKCQCGPCLEAIEETAVRQERLPFDPLLPFKPKVFSQFDIGNLYGGLAAWPERLQQAWFRGREAGYISVIQADEICIQLGVHPIDIFGPLWFEVDA